MIADPNLEVFRKSIGPQYSPLPLSAINANRNDGMLLIQEYVRAKASIHSARQPAISEGKIPDIDFYFIENTKANACAFEMGGRGYIGVFTGAVLLTRDLFYRMLSHPEILPRVGDSGAERVGPYHSQGLSNDYQDLLDGRPPEFKLEDVAPRDPNRRAYADVLARIALDFLVYHEFAHIRNGHCRYRNAITGTPFIAEHVSNAFGQSSSIDPLTSQVIEMEADSFAAHVTFWLHTTDSYARPLDYFGARVSDWCFTMMSFFWMWGWGANLSRLFQDPYPPPVFRSHGALTLARDIAADIAGAEFGAKFQEFGNLALKLARDAVKKISGGAEDPAMLAFYSVAKNVISAHWKTIDSDLKKLAYVTNL